MSLIIDCADRKDIFCKIWRRHKLLFSTLICSPSSFLRMARSAGAGPKRQYKKAYDPEFLYDFPPSSLFENFDLEEKGDTLQHVQSAKQSKTSKSKPAMVPATSPLND